MFKSGKTNFRLTTDGQWEITTDVDVKIKIYKKEGLEFANQQIPYYVGSNKERVVISDAFTYNIVNGKIEKTKLKSEGEFKEEVNERWNLKKITFPSVKEGSIIEYSYKIVSPYISNFSDWYFQYEIPVNYVKYEVYMPQYFVYSTVITGYENIVTEENYINGSDYSSTKYTYLGKNIPGLKEEEFVKNIDNYTSKLKLELASINYPNQPTKNVSLNWEDVAKSIYENDNFGKELNYKSYYEDEVKKIVSDQMSESEKMNSIFSYVQSNMNWNKNFGYNCENGVKKAFKDKIGNIADINLMLVSMLRFVNLDANPIILSTTSNGIAIFPSRLAFNYVIAGVKLNDGSLILLDASNKNTLPNIIPIRTINWFGRMILPSGKSIEVDLNPRKSSIKNVSILAELKDENVIVGKSREIFTDYSALIYKEKYGNFSNSSLIESFQKKYSGLEISEINVENIKSKPLNLNYSFTNNNSVELIGSKFYISPLLFLTIEENPFKSENRNYPIEFDFPLKTNYSVSFKIPENMEFEYVPSSITYKTPNNEIIFNFNTSNTSNTVQISSSLEINVSIINPQDYQILKAIFKEIINRHSDNIILKQK